MPDAAEHPALSASMDARMDYALVLGVLVSADGEISPEEKARVRDVCREIALPPLVADDLFSQSLRPDPTTLRESLHRLGRTELRLRLVEDMVHLGFADGRYDASERRQVRSLAAMMLVSEHEVRDIEDRIVSEMHTIVDDEPREPSWFAGVRDLYRRLTTSFSSDDT